MGESGHKKFNYTKKCLHEGFTLIERFKTRLAYHYDENNVSHIYVFDCAI